MKDFTIITYPGTRTDLLLSLTESRSRYMLPFGGRFRVVDFTLRNSFSSGARTTIIYNNCDDGLEKYVDKYGPFGEMKFPPIKVVSRAFTDISHCYNLILESNTDYYVIYNGDNPSIVDFTKIIKKYRSRRAKAILFRLNIDGKPTMAHTVLISDQKTLLKVVNKAIDEKHSAPNIFEMIINSMINSGVKKGSFDAYYWPIKNIPDYYNLNMQMVWDPEIFDMLFNEKVIQSKIDSTGYAHIGPNGKVKQSFISDYCHINGTVENSIIYPGVEIGEHTIIRDSIILPYTRIGAGSRITRSIIDERTELNPEEDYFNIGNTCKVGSDEEFIKNNDFPQSIFSSITLIGKDCHINEGTRIGGGCYVASGLGKDFFTNNKYLYDGMSVLK